jgi:hypothetical protein
VAPIFRSPSFATPVRPPTPCHRLEVVL